MFFSLAAILLLGFLSGELCRKIGIPPLFGMILTGIAIGPSALSLIDDSVLLISADIRKIALVIILTRAGLSLNISDLKKVGRPALLLSFIPACLEMAATAIIAPIFFGISPLEGLLIGTVVAAVSPAVIVPKMIKLTEEGYGAENSIPQMILAAASVDDVFVIAVFSALTNMLSTGNLYVMSFVSIPITIVTGIAVGLLVGFVLGQIFKRFNIRDTVKIIILMSISFLFVAFESEYAAVIPFSGLIAIMCMGISYKRTRPESGTALTKRYGQMWVTAEIALFVLVGASVDISYALAAGVTAVFLIFAVLVVRMGAVMLCLVKTPLNKKERVFCIFAYMPKATVQAAIGGIPLAMGLMSGELVLTVAVLSILITAPLGAFLIEATYKKLLEKA